MYDRLSHSDNIVAPATAAGRGAIGIIRLSGADVITIADAVFKSFKSARVSRNRRATLKNTESYKLVYGTVASSGKEVGKTGGDEKILDDVLVAVFRAPNSYTGENCVEIYCHASQYIMNQLIKLLIDKASVLKSEGKISESLRIASAGEFTQRAFLNGKMDLAQAEAVADLIASETEAAHDVAVNQMRGGYSKELKQMRDSLLNLESLMELELDFGEEDVEFADRKHLKALLASIYHNVTTLADSFALGNVIKNGIPVAIVGAVNTGKSTLLNALVGEERAIVSDIQGTTRDTIEDNVNIEGTVFRFIDTAGIRTTTETIEILGIERTYKKLKEAQIVLLMLDCAYREDFESSLQNIVSKIDTKRQKLIVIANKVDLLSRAQQESGNNVESARAQKKNDDVGGENISAGSFEKRNVKSIEKELGRICKSLKLSDTPTLAVSLKKSPDASTAQIKKLLAQYGSTFAQNIGGRTLVTNARHYQALKAATQSIRKALDGITQNIPSDLLAQDIRQATYDLGSIIGEVTSQDILNHIFANFCVGK